MLAQPCNAETTTGAAATAPEAPDEKAVLELTVRNHPGVMSHVCGLFTRRAFNLEGVLCMPVGDGSRSRVWLLVRERGERLGQVVKQLAKLHDVLEARRHGAGQEVFVGLEAFFRN